MLDKLLDVKSINLKLKGKTKDKILDELIASLLKSGKITDESGFKADILKREEQSSTALEEGIAIPHAKSKFVTSPSIAFGISKEGVDSNSLDGEKSKIFFMIAVPEESNNEHIEILSKLTTMLLEEDVREKLLNLEKKEDVFQILSKGIEKKEISNDEDATVLGVTACPTGIAHTYMAADSLRKMGHNMGIKIKVETNGSTGVKNRLTDEEIKNAKGIIIAADTNVEMERFVGKHVEIVSVTEGIKNPKKLIENALNMKAPIYTASQTTEKSNKREKTGFYKHLMSGVSNMLPFVVGGGILIAISFMFGIDAVNPDHPTYNKFAKLLMDIGGVNAFALMIPVLAGFIGMSIADRPGFAPAMVGGLIAANTKGGFLGALLAGFIGGYVILLLKKVFSGLPESLEGIKPVLIYPVLGIFITGSIMYIGVAGPVAALNSGMESWLTTLGKGNLIILGIVLGGMMATDMGGPINKAAFTFGIAMIAAGNFAPHAAVMAGGMVPPLGVALATTFFKNKFDSDEINAGKTCYILGLSFITEGVIPFAAADPIRIIPACMIGSAVAGGLSMAFGALLRAPHGGIFVIPIVTNPLMYLVAIAIGSVITAALIGILKPSKK